MNIDNPAKHQLLFAGSQRAFLFEPGLPGQDIFVSRALVSWPCRMS